MLFLMPYLPNSLITILGKRINYSSWKKFNVNWTYRDKLNKPASVKAEQKKCNTTKLFSTHHETI